MRHKELIDGHRPHTPAHARLIALVRSVRFRLTIWFGIILGLMLLAFSMFVYSRQVSTLQEQITNRLQDEGLKLLKYYDPRAGQLQFLGSDETSPLARNEILLIIDDQGHVIRTLGLSDADLAATLASDLALKAQSLSAKQVGLISTSFAGRAYLFNTTSTGEMKDAGSMSFFLGLPLDEDGQLQRLAVTLLLAGPVTLLLALAGGYWLAGRAMRPVRSITRMAQEIGETDLSRRLNLNANDEIGELARTFDQMLDRLQAAFDRQRQFTADASHELRTPLTIVSLEVNRALEQHALEQRPTPQEYGRTLGIIGAENENMARLVNDLLILARADAGQAGLKREDLDLSELTLDVV